VLFNVEMILLLGTDLGRSFTPLDTRLPCRVERWQSEQYRDELSSWISDEVGPLSFLAPVRLTSWVTVWAAQTHGRRFFAKQNCQLMEGEAALVATLMDLDPDGVVPAVATDPGRGLLLTVDQGRVVDEASALDDLGLWVRVLVAMAQQQRKLVPHRDRLSAIGVSSMVPWEVPEYAESRLGQMLSLPESSPMHLGGGLADALKLAIPTVQGWADEVAALGLPVTLNHNDLHENNFFAVGRAPQFLDYADALLTEPLAVLLIPLQVLSRRLRAGPDDPRLWSEADAALEMWSDYASMAQLRSALPAALQLARLGRVESWSRCCASMSDADLEDWGPMVPRLMATLLQEPPVGHARR
jgi:hypothetical protein